MSACLHEPGAVCWRCSDQDPRWRLWRIKARLGQEPPNPRPVATPRRYVERCAEPLTTRPYRQKPAVEIWWERAHAKYGPRGRTV